jgi:hypothetical protein
MEKAVKAAAFVAERVKLVQDSGSSTNLLAQLIAGGVEPMAAGTIDVIVSVVRWASREGHLEILLKAGKLLETYFTKDPTEVLSGLSDLLDVAEETATLSEDPSKIVEDLLSSLEDRRKDQEN